jgi:hypothetical protein
MKCAPEMFGTASALTPMMLQEPVDSSESLPEEMEMEDGLMLFQVKAGDTRGRHGTHDGVQTPIGPIIEEPTGVDSARLPLSPPFSNPLRQESTSPMSNAAELVSPPQARSVQLRSHQEHTILLPAETPIPLPSVVYDAATINATSEVNPIVISMPPPSPPRHIQGPDSARLSVPPHTSVSSVVSRGSTNWSVMDRPRTAFLPELRDGPGSATRPHSEDLHLMEDIRDQVGFALEQACAISQEKLHLRWAADTERHRREAGSAFLAMMSHEMRTVSNHLHSSICTESMTGFALLPLLCSLCTPFWRMRICWPTRSWIRSSGILQTASKAVQKS